MTKKENAACEKLMNEAIALAEQSKKEFITADKVSNENKVDWLSAYTDAMDHSGHALGIYQALIDIGFKHEKLNDIFMICFSEVD